MSILYTEIFVPLEAHKIQALFFSQMQDLFIQSYIHPVKDFAHTVYTWYSKYC